MKALIKIKRQANDSSEPYWNIFDYEGDGKITITGLLSQLNATPDLRQHDGSPATRIAWDCSCLQKRCGACSMVVNGNPVLACAVFVDECARDNVIAIEPLGKFPVVKDLKVDRSSAFEMLRDAQIWINESRGGVSSKDMQLRFKATECLMCGCCLEVCPNYNFNSKFGGASTLLSAYTAMTAESDSKSRKRLGKEYLTHFVFGCGESLSCKDICPAQLPLDEIQARTNKIR